MRDILTTRAPLLLFETRWGGASPLLRCHRRTGGEGLLFTTGRFLNVSVTCRHATFGFRASTSCGFCLHTRDNRTHGSRFQHTRPPGGGRSATCTLCGTPVPPIAKTKSGTSHYCRSHLFATVGRFDISYACALVRLPRTIAFSPHRVYQTTFSTLPPCPCHHQ